MTDLNKGAWEIDGRRKGWNLGMEIEIKTTTTTKETRSIFRDIWSAQQC